MATDKQIEDLKKLAISGYRAFRCCRGNGLRQRLAALQLIEICEGFIQRQLSDALVLLPRGSPVETAIMNVRVGPGPELAIAPGFTTEWVDITPDLPATLAQFAPTKVLVNKMVDTMNKEKSNCYNCVKRGAWKQSKKRARGKLVLKRGLDTSPIRVRVPHE